MPASRATLRGWLSVVAAAALLTACGGSSPAPAGSSDASSGGEPSVAASVDTGTANLCDAVTEQLALAAIGQPVGEPQSGQVIPRPNGIYCRWSAAADANVNVEAQLKEMTREEFDELAGILGMTEPLEGVGEAAFQLGRSTMGGAGASVAAWAGGWGVTVILNGEGDTAAQLEAVAEIADAALASAS